MQFPFKICCSSLALVIAKAYTVNKTSWLGKESLKEVDLFQSVGTVSIDKLWVIFDFIIPLEFWQMIPYLSAKRS